MTIELKDIFFISAILVMAFFLFDSCKDKQSIANQNMEIVNYKDSVSYYKSKTGSLVSYNQALEASSASQIKGLERDLKDLRLKKPKVIVRYKNKIQVDSIQVPLQIPCEEFSKNITVDSAHYKITMSLTDKALLFKSITIPNKQSIIVADKKEKWWKDSKYSVVVKNSNPYMRSVGLEAYTIEPEKKFYETRWFWITVGITSGLYLGNKIRII